MSDTVLPLVPVKAQEAVAQLPLATQAAMPRACIGEYETRHVQILDTAIPRARIARAFGAAAPHYDSFAVLQREVAAELCSLLPQRRVGTMLDLGCGTGYCAQLLRARHPHATLVALDLALPMLRLAARGCADMPLVCADAAALPLAAATLDLVCSSLALQWCPVPAQVFAELGRVLRPGGLALLSTFGPGSLRELRQAWAAVDGHVHVNRFAPIAELERALRASGLRGRIECRPRVHWYPDLRALGRELKGIGAHNMNAARPPGLSGRRALLAAERAFAAGRQDQRGIPVTYEVLYLILEAPA